MTNPFEQAAPAQQPQQPAAVNPFAAPAAPAAPQAYAPQQPAAPAPPAQPAGNPFAPSVPQQPAAPAQPAYAPQQPAYAPAAPQGYAPQQQAPQAYAAPAQPAVGAPPALNVGDLRGAGAPPPTGGKGAKLADMYGRLVLCFPLSISRVARNSQYITPEQRQRGDLDQERMVVTVVVLDDGQGGMQPIAYGGAPYALPPTPHTTSEPLPYVRKAMWITQTKLIEQLRPFLPAGPTGTPGMVAGRVVKAGPQGNDPWYLQGATEADIALAGQYLQLVQSSQYPHPLA